MGRHKDQHQGGKDIENKEESWEVRVGSSEGRIGVKGTLSTLPCDREAVPGPEIWQTAVPTAAALPTS